MGLKPLSESVSTPVLTALNQKGGTGKTLSTMNVGGALNERGADVLLVDLDAQGHLTEACGHSEAYDADGVSLHDVLTDLDQSERSPDLVRRGGEFDLLPAHVMLFQTPDKLRQEVRPGVRLRRALEHVGDDYDYIVLDCPPALNTMTTNALVAGRNVLIPAQARQTSKRAIELSVDQIKEVERNYEFDIMPPTAVIANEVTVDGEAEEMLAWFEETFGDVVPVFEIRSRVALQRAMSDSNASIFDHGEECDMEAVYLEIADYIMDGGTR